MERGDEQERGSTETVRTVNSSRDLSRGKESGDGLASGVNDARVVVNLESSHGVCAKGGAKSAGAATTTTRGGTHSGGRES